ncbi:interleukin-12 receptor subunit beta-2 [Labrus bergylta]|uniref:Interleukin 12 receptor, beta 2a n=1 Tax=Labrus bergylta TaxID=56723 RepID=A0A3Q3LD22_9LABR|nr:interleukin-12 receptor subunit beta-2-like [Labrus bergylta]XP_020509158.1 interleukin-12 receptor subunit beta-2-like [Labrus bergylta]
MATMSRTWTLLTAVLAVQLCTGQKACSIWSSAGSVVQRGSSFTVYCTFKCNSEGFTLSNHVPTQLESKTLNSTTIYHKVVNITKNRTFSCLDSCPLANEPCGMDIKAGLLPECPKNISCKHNVRNDEGGVVTCTWNAGRDTYLKNASVLWVTTVSGNHTAGPEPHNGLSRGSDLPSASFTVSSSAWLISVWVHVENNLSSATSLPVNFTLRDIAMPSAPDLGQPECSSQRCVIKVEQPVKTRYVEIQYGAEAQTWTSSQEFVQTGQAQVQTISSLEPFRLYHFRARSRFSTGMWSPWSGNTSGRTQEEAPSRALDVWSTDGPSDVQSLRLYWKELNVSIARGKIIQYRISVYGPGSQTPSFTTNVSADTRNCTVSFCAACEVKVWAYNSIGPSPPARVTSMHTRAKPTQDVNVTADNQSVAISWRNPEAAPVPAEYVVEWYPEGYKQEELQWVRLGRNDNHFVITGMKPAKCYEGAVYTFYDSSMDRTRFRAVLLESVPAAGPSVQEKVDGNKVRVTWAEIAMGQRGGCITEYTVYLENSRGYRQRYSVEASERTLTIHDLSPGVCSLLMTASTAEGEGPAGQKVKFFITQEPQLPLLLVCVVVVVVASCLLCLWHCSAARQRFCRLFKCLMLEAVLDPANSKWAKECTQNKGKINLQLPQSPCSLTEEEEEPILVDVEELPNQSKAICTPTCDSSRRSPETSLSPPMERTTLHYPLNSYIKSFSHDSAGSDHTETSLDTRSTVDYISSHVPGDMDEEDEEDEFPEVDGFFPSHNMFMASLEFGGKLTLDAVKINCTDFFQSS